MSETIGRWYVQYIRDTSFGFDLGQQRRLLLGRPLPPTGHDLCVRHPGSFWTTPEGVSEARKNLRSRRPTPHGSGRTLTIKGPRNDAYEKSGTGHQLLTPTLGALVGVNYGTRCELVCFIRLEVSISLARDPSNRPGTSASVSRISL